MSEVQSNNGHLPSNKIERTIMDAVDGFEDDFRSLLEDERFQPAADDADAAHWHQKYVDLLKDANHRNAREVRRVAAEAVLAATVKAMADGDDESDSED